MTTTTSGLKRYRIREGLGFLLPDGTTVTSGEIDLPPDIAALHADRLDEVTAAVAVPVSEPDAA